MSQRRRRQAPPSRRPPYLGTVLLFLFIGVATALGVWSLRSPGAPPGHTADVAAIAGSSTRSDVAARFVGAKTCVECHAPQGERWRQSMHARAMETPTPDSVKAPFAGERFSQHGVTTTFSRKRQPLRRPHRRPRWNAAGFRRRLHVRRRAVAAVPASVAWRTLSGTEHLVGHARGGRGRPAMVPPVPARAASRRRRPALDEPVAELERALRGMPFDQPAQGLRRGAQQLQDNLVGHQRGVRILSRRRVTPRRVGARTLVHSAARGQ